MLIGGAPRVLLPTHDRVPAPPPSGEVWDFAGETMGTTWSVRLVPAGGETEDSYRRTISDELAAQIALFSHWDPTSELSRYNAAPPGPFAGSPAFLDLIARCLAFAKATEGAVDPTLGVLTTLWGFGPSGPRLSGSAPSGAEIDAALEASGWRRVHLDGKALTLWQPGGLHLDLSGLAKGHAVDRVSARLTDLGATHHLAEIGGELVGRGVKPDGQPWWVDLEMVGSPARTRAALFDLAVATSGDAYRAVDIDGRRLGHTLDGRIGRPLNKGVASVTVFADTAFQADAWATALTVMGADDGLARAEAEGLAVAIVTRGDQGPRERVSAAWSRMESAA